MMNNGKRTIPPSGEKQSGMIQEKYALTLVKTHVRDKNAKILDVGSGTGDFLVQLNNEGYKNVSGVEVNKYNTPFDIKTADICQEEMPWSKNTFDVVCAWEVFEHLENPRAAMREIHRVLKPSGTFFLSMPNVFHLTSKLLFLKEGNFPRWNGKNDHYNVFTHKIFKKIFTSYFNLQEKRYCKAEIGKGPYHTITRRLQFLNRLLPENQWFGHFVVYRMTKNMATIGLE